MATKEIILAKKSDVISLREDLAVTNENLDKVLDTVFAEKSQTETGTSISPSNAKLIEKMDELWGKSEKSVNFADSSSAQIGKSWNGGANATRAIIDVKGKDTKKSYSIGAINNAIVIVYYMTSESQQTGTAVSLSGASAVIPPVDGCVFYRIMLQTSNSANMTQSIVDSCKIMFNEGSTALPYSPYFDGIHSIEEINVKTVGNKTTKVTNGYALNESGQQVQNADFSIIEYSVYSSIGYTKLTSGLNRGTRIHTYDASGKWINQAMFLANDFDRSVDLGGAPIVKVSILTASIPYFEFYTTKGTEVIPLASPLRGINDVRDRIYERTYKGMKSVDLSTLPWKQLNGFYYATLTGVVENTTNIVSHYAFIGSKTDSEMANADDMTFSLRTNQLKVKDSSGTPSGILHYEATEGGEDYTTYVCERDFNQYHINASDWVLNTGNIYYADFTGVSSSSVKYAGDKTQYGAKNVLATNFDNVTELSKAVRDLNVGEFKLTTRSSGNIVSFFANFGSDSLKDCDVIYELATPTITELSAEAIEVIRTIRNIDADHHLIVTDNYGNDVTYILTYLVEKATDNVVLVAPNGTKWKLTVSNSGQLSAVAEN